MRRKRARSVGEEEGRKRRKTWWQKMMMNERTHEIRRGR